MVYLFLLRYREGPEEPALRGTRFFKDDDLLFSLKMYLSPIRLVLSQLLSLLMEAQTVPHSLTYTVYTLSPSIRLTVSLSLLSVTRCISLYS